MDNTKELLKNLEKNQLNFKSDVQQAELEMTEL